VRLKSRLDDIPVTLDSRYRLLEFSGITAATPNEAEVEEALRLRVGQDWRKLVDAGDEVVDASTRVPGRHARPRWHGRLYETPQAR